jgi:hypothetical protein
MWVVWGRQVTRLALDTRAGPSWKPLPVLATTPFALLGPAAPALWLVTARAGALLALAGAWTLGRRLGGPFAGAAGAGAMALSTWWLPNAALGNSEGLLAAAVLWAWVAHLEGRRRAALALGVAAALLRPEAWPFLGLYGLWLWRADPSARRVLLAGGVAVPALWIVPSLLAGGGALGASDAAKGPASEQSAKLADHPLLAVLGDAVSVLGLPALACAAVAAALALAVARRPGAGGEVGARVGGRVAALAAAAVAWVAIVAAMTVGGYAGNPRYLVAAAAAGSVVAGVGAVRLAGLVRLPPAAALVLPLAVGAIAAGGLRDWVREVGVRADRRAELPRLVAAAGGRAALLRCAPVRTFPAVRGLVAWELDANPLGFDAPPRGPAVVVQMRPYGGGDLQPAAAPGRYEPRARAAGWAVRAACGASRG